MRRRLLECEACARRFRVPQALFGHLRHCHYHRLKRQAKAKAEKKNHHLFLTKTNDVGRLWLPTDKSQKVCVEYSFVVAASWLLVMIPTLVIFFKNKSCQ